jgi:hypothetical protein
MNVLSSGASRSSNKRDILDLGPRTRPDKEYKQRRKSCFVVDDVDDVCRFDGRFEFQI